MQNKKFKHKKINKHNLIRQIEIVFYVLIVTTEKIIKDFMYKMIIIIDIITHSVFLDLELNVI